MILRGVIEELNTSIVLLTETVMKQYESIKRLELRVTVLERASIRRALKEIEEESLETQYDSLG